MLGLFLVVGGLGLGLVVWERTLSRIADLIEVRGKQRELERKLAAQQEQLELVEEHLAGIAKSVGWKLAPGP